MMSSSAQFRLKVYNFVKDCLYSSISATFSAHLQNRKNHLDQVAVGHWEEEMTTSDLELTDWTGDHATPIGKERRCEMNILLT